MSIPGLGLLKNKIRLVAIGFIAILLFAGWYMWNDMQSTIQEQASTITALNIKLQNKDKVIAQKDKDIALQRDVTKAVNKKFKAASNEVIELRDKFKRSGSGRSRDLGKIAIARPKVVERLINRGTTDANRCVEIASGSPLTEDEKNAVRKSQTNALCTSLANPNYLEH